MGGDHPSIQYEVRLSNSLENVLVDPAQIKRLIALNIRLHSYKGGESHNIVLQMRVDATVQQVLAYIGMLQQIPMNFINLFHKCKKLNNSSLLYKEGILDGDKVLSVEGQGDLHSFYRFKSVSNGGWSYSQNNWDAIVWRPNRTIMVAGFGTYGIYNNPQKFLIRYKFVVQNQPTDETEVEVDLNSMNPGTKIYPIMLDGDLIEVPAGTDFVIQMRGYGPGQSFSIRVNYGQGGNSYKSYDN